MAKAQIVYESVFGDNEALATAIAKGLGRTMEVSLLSVQKAGLTLEGGLDLVVVGGPTQGFGLSRESTRQGVHEYSANLPLPEIGVGEWLNDLTLGPGQAPLAAAFGTNIGTPFWVRRLGKSAKKIEAKLKKKGFQLFTGSQVFLVETPTGPLIQGEIERARRWGEKMGARFEGEFYRPSL